MNISGGEDMFVDPITSVLLEEAWRERAAVAQFFKDLRKRVTEGEFELFMYGSGGVGKTVLGRLLNGEYTLESVPPDYDLSLETEEHSVEGRYFTAVYVPPGQEDKRGYTWDELHRELQKAKRYAIINVCCWGYHSILDVNIKQHKLYSPGMTEQEFLRLFLEEQRISEIRALEELLPHLKTAPGKLRMLTLITKQDLWWPHRDGVKQHYEKGQYNELITDLRDHRGVANFSHDYISASLNLLNFKTGDITLSETAAGYDNAVRLFHYNRAMKYVHGLIK